MSSSIGAWLLPQKNAPSSRLPPDLLFSLPLVRVPQLRLLLNASTTKELLAGQCSQFSYRIVPQENTSYEYERTLYALTHRIKGTPRTPLPTSSGFSHTFYFNASTERPFYGIRYTNLPLSLLEDIDDFQRIIIPQIVNHLQTPATN